MDYSISTTEGEQEEWKEVFNDTLLEKALQTLCGFLNSNGGKIIFGVNCKGKPTKLGCDLDEAQRKVFDMTRNFLKPNASTFFKISLHEDKLYIFVKPDPANIYQYRGVIYKRTGSSTHALTYDEAKTLEQQRKKGIREITPGVFSRISQGEMLKCNNPACGYSEISGMSSVISIGGPPPQRSCPQCGGKLVSNSD